MAAARERRQRRSQPQLSRLHRAASLVQCPEVTSTVKGDSASASLTGTLADGLRVCAGSICSTYIAVEYGTIPVKEVLTALRGDHWLYAHSGPSDPRWDAIKKGIRDAFYVDESWWKAAVYGRSVDMILRAGRGLGSP
jgi:Protein of unknown function (DUF2817)